MPVWHEKTRDAVRSGKLVLLGVIQEQHPDRCRLFAQWKRFDWPILHDPINVLGARGVPIVTAIDEHGIVRSRRLRPDRIAPDFLERQFHPPSDVPKMPRLAVPNLDAAGTESGIPQDSAALRDYADALVLWGGAGRIEQAIDAYTRVLKQNPSDGAAHFRLGVCYRMRYDSPSRQRHDFQRAVDSWTRALEIDPNHYIWRRRIQQYGPRLDKPYPFYDWVAEARRDISAGGGNPIPLMAEPGGAEIARPGSFSPSRESQEEPDPRGRIRRDKAELILAETTVVRSSDSTKAAAQVHIVFRPNSAKKAHWNNEASPLVLWVRPPAGWQVDRQRLVSVQPKQAVSDEIREFNFEVRRISASAEAAVSIPAYALYYACEDVVGTCVYVRRDFAIRVRLDGRRD